jgi:prepilin-type N-terminal cleavage/methylation domain-containing protein
MRPRRPGFTLIELLIVITIVGILATIAIRTFWDAKDRGLESSMKADLRKAVSEQELFFEENLTYAGSADALTSMSLSPGVSLEITYAAADGWAGVTTHGSLAGGRCGLLIGAATTGSADPAEVAGVIKCIRE